MSGERKKPKGNEDLIVSFCLPNSLAASGERKKPKGNEDGEG